MIRKVIVGLGNPEPQYENTRHNTGYLVMDLAAAGVSFRHDVVLNADIAVLSIEGVAVVLVKPTTGMNSSGEAVAVALKHYAVASADLLVVHDDVSLPMGKLRFQQGGSAGGQHGVESIIEQLSGERGFARLKCGVGPDPGGAVRFEFVTSKISTDLHELYNEELQLAAQAVRTFLADGMAAAMSGYNGRDLRT